LNLFITPNLHVGLKHHRFIGDFCFQLEFCCYSISLCSWSWWRK